MVLTLLGASYITQNGGQDSVHSEYHSKVRNNRERKKLKKFMLDDFLCLLDVQAKSYPTVVQQEVVRPLLGFCCVRCSISNKKFALKNSL